MTSTAGPVTVRPALPRGAHVLAARSAALLAEVVNAADGRPEAVLVSLEERGPELVAALLGRDWLHLVDQVRTPQGAVPVVAVRWAAQALHHLGHLHDAARVIGWASEAGGPGEAAARSRVAATRAALAWSRGDTEAARNAADEALTLAESVGDPGAQGQAWVAHALLAASTGDRDANVRCYVRALELAQEADDLLTVERVHNNVGSGALEEGRFEAALEHLQAGLTVNEATGHLSGLAVLRHNVAEALLGLGRLDEALLECDASRDLWTALEAPSVSASWQLRGDIHVARGNATQAAMSYHHAAVQSDAEQDAQTHAIALAGLAAAEVASDAARAVELADRAVASAVPVSQTVPVVTAGWVRLATGDATGAAALAQRGLELASVHRDLPWMAQSLELAALSARPAPGDGADPRLREAAGLWRTLGNPLRATMNDLVVATLERDRLAATVARDELRAVGVHDDAWRIAGPLHQIGVMAAPEVRIHVLGTFAVTIAGQPVPPSAWPSRKTREVLKVLAVRGARGISRERLGALLWPDADAVGNRLSVAMSHARAVLDPERRHGPDHYLVADRDTVRLDLAVVDVDVQDFVAAARTALASARAREARAVRMLETAAAMHTGLLCEDELDAAWVEQHRDEVEVLGLEVLRALADALGHGPTPADALPWLARLIAQDPYDEPTYVLLVRLLCGLGRYGEARRHYRGYVLRAAELGVEPPSWDELCAPAAPRRDGLRGTAG